MKPRSFPARLWLTTCLILMVGLPWYAVPAAAARANTPDVARIDAFVGAQVERHGIPGLALALVAGDQVIYAKGYGKADQSGRAVTPQTPFVLASASKPITALAIMQLVDQGAIELDAPVQRYLATFRVADPVASQQITVRHLLNHTSGIPEQGCQSNRFGAKTLQQFVAALQTITLDTPVGTRHFYCSGNYNILGRIIEVVSGQSYADYVEQHVFTPLHMRHSFASEQRAQQDSLAQQYSVLFGVPVPMAYPFEAAQVPSGLLIASAEDMAHFLVAQLNNGRYEGAQVVSPQSIAAMHAPGVPVGDGTGTYGLGWRIGSIGGVPTISHAGDNPNAHTLIFVEPQTRRGAVLLLNSQSMLAQFSAFQELQGGVAQLLAGSELAPLSLSLRTLYVIVDAVLGGVLVLALWPLLQMRRWEQRLQQQQQTGSVRRWRLGLRLGWEFGAPIVLLVGTRVLLALIGAQSWNEGLLLFPDLGMWIWAIALLMLLAGAGHLLMLQRVIRQNRTRHQVATTFSAT